MRTSFLNKYINKTLSFPLTFHNFDPVKTDVILGFWTKKNKTKISSTEDTLFSTKHLPFSRTSKFKTKSSFMLHSDTNNMKSAHNITKLCLKYNI